MKNGGTSSSTSSSPGSAQNHHTEEHAATNNPNQAPMPLQDNQHASSENSGQILQGESGSSPSTAFQTNFGTTSQDGGPSSSSSVNELPPIPRSQSSHSQSTTKPRLPKLVLPKINGEITKFKSFMDRLDSAVNKNADLSSVDKFNYLHALLEGQAARAIQGLTLSESNYQAAVEIYMSVLVKRNKSFQLIWMSLSSCQLVRGINLVSCELFTDKIKINVRSLESLGVKAEQYGSFLIPVIMSRLPAEVRLHVARVSAKDVWEINELLKVIQAEVEAREMSDTIKIQEKKGLKQLLHPREDFPQELLSHYLQG